MNDQDQARQQKKEMVILSVIFVALFCICFLALVAVLLIYTRNFNAFSADPNFLIPATPTPATCPKIPTGWTLEINETFDNNKKDWPLGLEYGEYGKTRSDIIDGKYNIQVTVNRDVNYYYFPLMDFRTSDFFLRADVRQVEGPSNSLYGIIFRLNYDGDRYFFGIRDTQRYILEQRFKDEWFELIPITYSPIVKPGEANQLTVLAQDSHFYFCINQLLVDEIENGEIESGIAGFSYTLFDEGDTAEFEFDNFRLYVPPTIE